MKRCATVVLTVLVLVAAACGDDDEDPAAVAEETTEETTEDTATEDGDAPPMGPAEITAQDQSGDGTSVTVEAVSLPAPGFMVVHADADGSPGPVIGHSELLPEGDSTDVVVPLDEPLTEGATVWPMAHIDTNTNETYDFAPPDVTEDGPATFENGEVAVVAITYTVEGDSGADGGGDDGATGEAAAASVTIQGFEFMPETIEVEPGATVTWSNEDDTNHTVTSGSPGEASGDFDETVDAGSSAEITLEEAGSYPYFCAIHPNMTGEVVVG